MVKVLSWDVGVINLAYCFMTKTKNGFKIYDWQKINLMEDGNHNCDIKDCGKPALWCCDIDSGNHYYCGIHKSQKNILYPAKKQHKSKCECDHKFKQKGKSCNDEIKFTVCYDKKNVKHYCNKHKPSDIPIIRPIKKQGAKKCPTMVLQKKLLEKLDEMKDLLDADIVVIENQPSLKNPKMKAISATLYDFYLIRSTIDKDIIDNNIEKVVFMNPSNKLKLDDNNSITLAKTEKKKKYKITKELAVQYCRKLLENDREHTKFLESHKKKDDLCDCFLQGCYYLSNKI